MEAENSINTLDNRDVSDISIDYVELTTLHDVWPLLRIGLEDIIKKTQPDWIAEDVYANLRDNAASAYLVRYKGVIVGWFIVCTSLRPFNHKKDLLMWAGWSMPVKERQRRGVDTQGLAIRIERAAFTFCESLAVQHGYHAVAFLSSRSGMRKRAEEWGYATRATRYEKVIGVHHGRRRSTLENFQHDNH